MTGQERTSLIAEAVRGETGTWADLGAGAGAFTLVLASLLTSDAVIYAVDRDPAALARLKQEAASRVAASGPSAGAAVRRQPRIECRTGDFATGLVLPPLRGALMANSLHFHADHCGLLRHVARWLLPGGRLIIVEYDTGRANPWVPHPLPWSRLESAARCAGLSAPRLLGTSPSSYHGSMYAAVCDAP